VKRYTTKLLQYATNKAMWNASLNLLDCHFEIEQNILGCVGIARFFVVSFSNFVVVVGMGGPIELISRCEKMGGVIT
jgi:hypothetical protein